MITIMKHYRCSICKNVIEAESKDEAIEKHTDKRCTESARMGNPRKMSSVEINALRTEDFLNAFIPFMLMALSIFGMVIGKIPYFHGVIYFLFSVAIWRFLN